MKILPIYYCQCCKNCVHRDKYEMKSLFNVDYLVHCADINGLGMTKIIPNVFHVIDWCKISEYEK